MRFTATLALALLRAGCASEQEWQAQAQAEAINANDDAKCNPSEPPPGSQAYIQCRMNLNNQRAAMRQTIAGQIVGNMLNH